MERQRRLVDQVGLVEEANESSRRRRRRKSRKQIQDFDEEINEEEEEGNEFRSNQMKMQQKKNRTKLKSKRSAQNSYLINETKIRLAFTLSLILLLLWPKLAASQSIASLQQSIAQQLQVFSGNESQATDSNHFKLLERQGDFVLVGARNVVYNLSLSSMREQRRLEWPSSDDDVRLCRMKGKSSEQCHNYIRVLKLQTPDTLLVCGTNAYKPKCRTYAITSSDYYLVSEAPGEGLCPYQENQNVTSLFADGHIYSATAAQFSGIDGLIHRAPLRTEQFNPKQLNSPNFVNSFRYGEHVYFLFREPAIEHLNCGKTIYSRIARVCINDKGGQTRASRERWTSFVKARLNCSIPGEFPFYFDEIQASTQIISSFSSPSSGFGAQMAPVFGQSANPQQPAESQHQQVNPNSDLLYAVFTTPTNSIGGSAVCAYRMADVLEAFDGPFKSQADSNSNWLPVAESKVPQPRPGSCVNDSRLLPDEHINFIKDNPLMDSTVEPVWSQPLVMMASINFRFTQIAVDAQVETQQVSGAQQMRTDVIFVATDDGRVFKLINTQQLLPQQVAARQHQLAAPQSPYYLASQLASANHRMPAPSAYAQVMLANQQPQQQQQQQPPQQQFDVSANTIVIEELHLFDARTPINNLLIHYPAPNLHEPLKQQAPAKLLVLSGKQLKAIPLSRCERALTCQDCLALYDPYCAWDIRQQSCLSVGRSLTGQSAASDADWRVQQQQQIPRQHSANNMLFPPNNVVANNYTLAWWLQCPPSSSDFQQQPQQQQVGAPYRSLFSSHLQVPSRFDYASGHHLSRSALVSLAPPQAASTSPAQPFASGFSRPNQQAPVSECLTFCGGLYSPQPILSADSQQLMASCADYVQQHYIGVGGIGGGGGGGPGGQVNATNLYTSENLYLAVIICALAGLLCGLLFGFAIGRNARKHDSSVCSSTFDETNLYMVSTGSHQGANLFASQVQPQHQRSAGNHNSTGTASNLHHHQHPLLQHHPTGLLGSATANGQLRSNHNQLQQFDQVNQNLLQESIYGIQQQQQQLQLQQPNNKIYL